MSVQAAAAVRRARPGDHAAVRALLARQAGVAPGRGDYTRRHHADNLARFGDGLILAECGGVVVGHAGVRQGPRADAACVVEFFVLPEYRGRGVGRALWDQCTVHAWALWANELHIAVPPGADDLRRFVERQGAAVLGHLVRRDRPGDEYPRAGTVTTTIVACAECGKELSRARRYAGGCERCPC